MKTFVFGKTSLGLPTLAYQFENSATSQEGASKKNKHVLVIGGVHGDEIEGVALCSGLLSKLIENSIEGLKISLVPLFNSEGVFLKTRQNHKGVDLNRNLPTKDWDSSFSKIRYYPGESALSETENQALDAFLQEDPVDFIISIHSWKPMLNVNGDCSPIAQHISEKTGYIIKEDIGYPTPGSLGTYAGLERQIPTLTYEIQKGIDLNEVLDVHLEPLYESLKLYSKS